VQHSAMVRMPPNALESAQQLGRDVTITNSEARQMDPQFVDGGVQR
jgi:hypothetical protein